MQNLEGSFVTKFEERQVKERTCGVLTATCGLYLLWSLTFLVSGFPLGWPEAQEGPAASDLESPWMMSPWMM